MGAWRERAGLAELSAAPIFRIRILFLLGPVNPNLEVNRVFAKPTTPLSAIIGATLLMAARTQDRAPEKGPATTVTEFFQRLAEHDTDAVLALLHEDFVFRTGDGTVVARRKNIRPMLEWDAAAHSRIEIESLQVEGDEVHARIRERNRFTDLLGLKPWEVEATFTVRDGQIRQEVARERAAEGSSFNESFQRALQPVAAWAAKAHPEEAAAVFDAGRVTRYDGPTARRLLRLLEAYERQSV